LTTTAAERAARGTVLVVSWDGDEHAQAVLAELARLGAETYLLDLARFPRELRLAAHLKAPRQRSFTLESPERGRLDLGAVRTVWWRRPRPFTLHAELVRPAHQSFAYNEALEAMAGLWQALDARWVNHPTRDEVAARKLYQLRVAQEVGLRVPATLVTNHPDEARAFVEANGVGQVIYKAFSATEQAWRETRLIRPEEVGVLDSVAYAPVIFQEYVPAGADLRVTAIGEQLFAAAIYAGETTYPVDFRIDMGRARIEPAQLPAHITVGLRALMDRLGLVYGAIDMRRTPDGEHVFLEINPAGQWLFVESRAGLPITAALARELCACGG
jgi:glutathione synthase/RimK-type ligase-like ATP-grasp enzyme